VPPSPRPAYEPKAWEEVPCPFCGSAERRLYERFGWKLRFTYQWCLGCGLVYQSPRPRYDDDFVRDAYGDYFTFSEDFRPGDPVNHATQANWEELVAEVATFDRQRTAVLDVGSGMGSFLLAARPLWGRAEGVEISDKMRAFVQREIGVRVHGVPFETLAPEGRFSCIHMSHVLEHVPDPSAWMARARALLEEGGLLVVAVPNMLSLDRRYQLLLKRARLRKGEWGPSKTPDHLFEPTVPSMLRFLDRQGFDVVSHYTYSRSDETSRKPFSRLYRRRLLLGSNARFYARPRPGRSGI
jgi:SAM-dependent methyltransferase